MRRLLCIVCAGVLMLVPISPLLAQTNQSGSLSATTTSSSSSSSKNNGVGIGIGVGIGVGLIGLGLLSNIAFPKSFGGKIVAVVPCSAGLHVTIVPAGLLPVSYIWTPATITFSAGPPRNPGQQILGLYDTPFICFVGKVPLFGLRMLTVGTSAF